MFQGNQENPKIFPLWKWFCWGILQVWTDQQNAIEMGICLLPYEFDRIANHLIWVSSIWYGGLACQGTIAGSCWNLRCRAMTTRNSLEKLGCRALLMRYLMVIPLHLWFEAQGSTWRLVLVLPCSTNFIGQLAADFDHHNPWELMIVIGIIGISSQTNGWFSSRLRFFLLSVEVSPWICDGARGDGGSSAWVHNTWCSMKSHWTQIFLVDHLGLSSQKI